MVESILVILERKPTRMILRLVVLGFASMVGLLSIHSEDADLGGSNVAELYRSNGLMVQGGVPYSGITRENYSEGSLQSETFWENGTREGLYSSWYENGQLKEKRYYRGNRKEGEHLGWYENGKLRFQFNFSHGNYHGSCKQWYSDGSRYSLFHYENGEEVGSQIMWEADGRVRANYVVKNGRRYGIIGSKRCVTISE